MNWPQRYKLTQEIDSVLTQLGLPILSRCQDPNGLEAGHARTPMFHRGAAIIVHMQECGKTAMAQPDNASSDDFAPFLLQGKALERHFSMQDALIEFSRLFRDEENDRALAIVGGAFLDTLLENILIEFLIEDEKEVGDLLRYDGPMGGLSARIRTAYCLGLLRKSIRDDLRLVAKIRNRFAHNLSASFEQSPISDWCNALRFHRESFIQPPAGSSARDLFYVEVSRLIGYLDGYISIARGEKRLLPKGN